MNDIAKFYDKLCQENKENWKACHWASRESQEDNFNIMLQISPLEPTDKILDLGCGTGDFYGFLKKRGWKASYEGIDVSQNMIDRAWTKFPESRFAQIDFLSDQFNYKYDWIFACGPFNHKTTDQYEYLEKCIKKMHTLAKKGCAMILSSKHDPNHKDDSPIFGYDPVKALELSMKFTPFVNFNHVALSWGFILFLYNYKWMLY
jgi:cyclopropane fatty-acyl-phospholipid synthase-like methyltransferase